MIRNKEKDEILTWFDNQCDSYVHEAHQYVKIH